MIQSTASHPASLPDSLQPVMINIPVSRYGTMWEISGASGGIVVQPWPTKEHTVESVQNSRPWTSLFPPDPSDEVSAASSKREKLTDSAEGNE